MKLTTPITWELPIPDGTYKFTVVAAGEKENANRDGRNVWVDAVISQGGVPYEGRLVKSWYPVECKSRNASIRAEEQLVSLSKACGLLPPVTHTDGWMDKIVMGRVVRKERDAKYPERNEVVEWFPSPDEDDRVKNDIPF